MSFFAEYAITLISHVYKTYIKYVDYFVAVSQKVHK